jgi:purine-binding chemotaxis protein CheW
MAERAQLHERQDPQASSGAGDWTQYLTFNLGGETFAMEIGCIREVIPCAGLTRVPLMPDCIRGVINLRGAVVPVLDLALRFDRAPTVSAQHTCIVILELRREEDLAVLGVMVDSVSEVLEIHAGDVEPAPAFGCSLREDFIQGIGKVAGGFVILLDVQHVVPFEDLAPLPGDA